eukprot:4739108-Pyramimonas_sp.AAC.1
MGSEGLRGRDRQGGAAQVPTDRTLREEQFPRVSESLRYLLRPDALRVETARSRWQRFVLP